MTISPDDDGPWRHRTIDRVTQIVEEVVYHPGITFAELARVLDAPKSSVHGFIRGLVATGWLHQEDRRFYLGPAIYALTLAGGHLRAGLVSQAEVDALHRETGGMTALLGVVAGDHLIYVAESGMNSATRFASRNNIRRTLIGTAGGKALLASFSDSDRAQYLRKAQAEDPDAVATYLSEHETILNTGVARNFKYHRTQMALATVVRNQAGEVAAVVVIVGMTSVVEPREGELSALLLRHVAGWSDSA
jgi:DNA-binding IclR family transcriptional regulator